MPTERTELSEIAAAICKQRSLRLLGLAGYGSFKETFHVSTANREGEDYALKVFRPNMSPERTDREVDAMHACDHPNIVRVLAVESVHIDGKDYTYTLEEFLAGGTLASTVEKHGTLDTSSLIDLGCSLVDAVAHIAERNLVHRDIKPENVLYRKDGTTPVIVDFGLVRDLASSPLTMSWILRGPGTPFYSAPEQLNNERQLVDWRTDQFALGVTLFIVRWGMHPFGAANQRGDEIVGAVAERRTINAAAKEMAEEEGLGILLKMIDPWSVRRFRTPDSLISEWQGLKKD